MFHFLLLHCTYLINYELCGASKFSLTKRLSSLSQLSYRDRLVNLELETLECRILVYNLVFLLQNLTWFT